MIPDSSPSRDCGANTMKIDSNSSSNFICGVVEGFYGRPWTSEQRKKLFKRMSKLSMNTYIYAPKDDSKHRMYWRELYTVEEAGMLTTLIELAEENGVTFVYALSPGLDMTYIYYSILNQISYKTIKTFKMLTTLIESAEECGVTFVYALSPGLDMTYSSPKEVSSLKRKLKQVSSFGCKAFALLFDDIEADMCEADKGFFQSFAFAQVSVTNEVYQHLQEPSKFFFCPTEYCASRAVPSVPQSEYLQTIGSKLLPGIDVMWTGPKVISKRISIKSVEEVSSVLHRAPLIWDNIHANDYDQKRIFLGPYDGRSPELIPYLRGVLTNPNCEFESNYIALHTLAQWSHSNAGGVKKDCILSTSELNSADIKLETDGEYTVDEDSPAAHTSPNAYTAKHALHTALIDWHNEFFDKCSAPRKLNSVHPGYPPFGFPTILPPVPVIDPKSSTSDSVPIPVPSPHKSLDPMAVLEMSDSYVKPPSAVEPHNGLIDNASSDDSLDMTCPLTDKPGTDDGGEPMDFDPSAPGPADAPAVPTGLPASSVDEDDDTGSMIIDTASDAALCDVEITDESGDYKNDDKDIVMTADTFTISDITQIVDLFYLPFEHGRWSVDSLSEFHWLKTNCTAALGTSSADLSSEWSDRCRAFLVRLKDMCCVVDRLNYIPNKALLYELFPYVWDIKAVLLLMYAIVQWLGKCRVKSVGQSCLIGGPYSWGNRGYGDYTMSGEREPWLFRGGVLGEFQRMLPFECCTDLLFYTIPIVPTTTMFTVRPYTNNDREGVYKVCMQTCNDGGDGSSLYPDQPSLIPDRLIGCYLEHSSEMCFVIEDDEGSVCGYVLSCADARVYDESYRSTWLPTLISRYSHLTLPPPSPSSTTPQELVGELYSKEKEIGELCGGSSLDTMLSRHPSIIRLDILRDRLACDPTAPPRALACTVAALKVSGSCGVFTKLHVRDVSTAELYRRLGFFEIPFLDSSQPVLPLPPVSSVSSLSSSSSSSSSCNAAICTTTPATITDSADVPAVPAADEQSVVSSEAADETRTTTSTDSVTPPQFIHMGRII